MVGLEPAILRVETYLLNDLSYWGDPLRPMNSYLHVFTRKISEKHHMDVPLIGLVPKVEATWLANGYVFPFKKWTHTNKAIVFPENIVQKSYGSKMVQSDMA